MDDYEQMKIFNPYVQMALGILAGNSGVNKSQAFANAMQGGLGAITQAQDLQRKQVMDRRQGKLDQMKLDEYDRMRVGVQQTRDWAKKQYEADPKGPMASFYKGIADSEDPDVAMKMAELTNRAKYNEAIMNRGSQDNLSGVAETWNFRRNLPQDEQAKFDEWVTGANASKRAPPRTSMTLTEANEQAKAAAVSTGIDSRYWKEEDITKIRAAGREAQKNGEDPLVAMEETARGLASTYEKGTLWGYNKKEGIQSPMKETTVKTQEEYDALPSGSFYIDPNGQRRQKK